VVSPLVAVRQADRGDNGGRAAIRLARELQLLSGVRHPARSWAAAQAAHAGIDEVPELVARWPPTRGHHPTKRPGSDIATIRADGSGLRVLTHGGNNFNPDWSR